MIPKLHPLRLPALLCLAGVLTGCAAGGQLSQGYAPSDGPPTETSAVSTLTAAGDYNLSPEEAEFACKKLAGLVQIRILEVRSGLKPEEASAISRTLQSAGAMFGGSQTGLNPAAEHHQQVAQLVAYNKQLASKNCRSFDLAQALASNESLPSPTIPPKAATR